MIDTGKLTDLKTELEQLCMDVQYLIDDTSDEAKAQEVANSLDEMIELAGGAVVMLQGEEAGEVPDEAAAEETTGEEAPEVEPAKPLEDVLREWAGLPATEEAPKE